MQGRGYICIRDLVRRACSPILYARSWLPHETCSHQTCCISDKCCQALPELSLHFLVLRVQAHQKHRMRWVLLSRHQIPLRSGKMLINSWLAVMKKIWKCMKRVEKWELKLDLRLNMCRHIHKDKKCKLVGPTKDLTKNEYPTIMWDSFRTCSEF